MRDLRSIANRISHPAARLAALISVGLCLVPVTETAAQKSPKLDMKGEISEEIRAFCSNIADAARDQRYLLQKKELDGLQTDIEKRIAELETRRIEYERWLNLRNDFLERAEDGLVEIYKNMRADSAAEKLELVDINVAAAIVMKLKPRLASQILNEMDNKTAAHLTGIIASAADSSIPKEPS
ncbi:MAG: MotE family protein [Alphaproteobacteria bacterium]|nr:MotE family protein [Alphaproteobacteria bacterium]